MVKLAIFDIDYTLTKKETLMEFFKFMIKKDLKNIRYIPRALLSGIMFITRAFDEKQTKETFLKFIEGMEEEQLDELVKEFYNKRLSSILYKDAMDMIYKMKSKGYLIYLISASPEFYLNEFYNIKEIDKIIGTKYITNDGRHTRRMDGLNCKGEEKVERLKQELSKENIEVDYEASYMFSDSLSDKPLFDLVGNPYLINFKKDGKGIKILNWK